MFMKSEHIRRETSQPFIGTEEDKSCQSSEWLAQASVRLPGRPLSIIKKDTSQPDVTGSPSNDLVLGLPVSLATGKRMCWSDSRSVCSEYAGIWVWVIKLVSCESASGSLSKSGY